METKRRTVYDMPTDWVTGVNNVGVTARGLHFHENVIRVALDDYERHAIRGDHASAAYDLERMQADYAECVAYLAALGKDIEALQQLHDATDWD